MKIKTGFLNLIVALTIGTGCNTKEAPMPMVIEKGTPDENNPNGYPTVLTVDCAVQQGNVMRIEQANVHSTTSELPGEKARTWIKSLNHTTIRTWLALRTIYNDGYNYKYSSGANVEPSLAYYSDCADSLLIALTAYTPSQSQPLPAKGAPFQSFIKQTLVYYKTKYPKIKYIQAGNEPDYNGESAADYYQVYKDYYKAINAANAELGLTGNNKLLLSNAAFTSTSAFSGVMSYTNQFLALYAADPDSEKKLDFFSFNCYTEQTNPKIFETAKPQIHAAMANAGLPAVPVFVTEYGLSGGNFIPAVWNQTNVMTAWAPAQLAKAYYLYEGGVSKVFNWSISHGTILHKSELGDLENAYANPYGNALVFCRELSSRIHRVKSTTTKLSDKGLGINALAALGETNGLAVLAWNYNYTNSVLDQNINVSIQNIPESKFSNKINVKVYMIDSGHNNFYKNPNQNSITALSEKTLDYTETLSVPIKFEANAVALIVLTPQG